MAKDTREEEAGEMISYEKLLKLTINQAKAGSFLISKEE